MVLRGRRFEPIKGPEDPALIDFTRGFFDARQQSSHPRLTDCHSLADC